MTPADKLAADALARHFAYESGGFWEHLDPREQAVYRARALDVVQVVGPIYQPRRASRAPMHGETVTRITSPFPSLVDMAEREGHRPDPDDFPRPMSQENDR